MSQDEIELSRQEKDLLAQANRDLGQGRTGPAENKIRAATQSVANRANLRPTEAEVVVTSRLGG